MRAKGFKTYMLCKRLGDPEVFLLKLHGVGLLILVIKVLAGTGTRRSSAVIPQASELLINDNDKLIWLLEGQVLSQSELEG